MCPQVNLSTLVCAYDCNWLLRFLWGSEFGLYENAVAGAPDPCKQHRHVRCMECLNLAETLVLKSEPSYPTKPHSIIANYYSFEIFPPLIGYINLHA